MRDDLHTASRLPPGCKVNTGCDAAWGACADRAIANYHVVDVSSETPSPRLRGRGCPEGG